MASSIEEASVPTLVLKEGAQTQAQTQKQTQTVTIHLTEQEELVFETILRATEYLEQQGEHSEKVQVRIAGGWVRDKLLGISTHDVDIAIDTLSGVEFATAVQSYLNMKDPSQVHKMGVIAANPNQSKHLETATMLVMGLECDFCNLRAEEVYTNDSRIPDTVAFGTPLQDAQRRDFTLNALFFNLQTRQVEDWTGRGLSDLLTNKMLVTPLDPFTTFQDDPLRVLRALRFAIRLDFALDPTLTDAATNEAIQTALLQKVSRERVGKELEGMLSGTGARPHKAMELIGSLNLSDCVFTLPDDVKLEGAYEGQLFTKEMVPALWATARESLLPRMELVQCAHTMHDKATSSLNTRLFAMATYLLPFRNVFYMDRKAKKVGVVEFIIRDSIKFKNKDVAAMTTLMEHVDSFVKILVQPNNCATRLEVGLLLRVTKDLWVTCLWLASVLTPSVSLDDAQRVYVKILVDLNLDLSWKTRPLLDGRALIQALGLPKGPVVGTYLQEQVKWMFQHPDGSKEECLEHLVGWQKQLESKRRIDHDGGKEEESKRAHLQGT